MSGGMYVSEHSYGGGTPPYGGGGGGYGGGYGGNGMHGMSGMSSAHPGQADYSSWCCNGGSSSYTAMGQVPRAWRKELFVNVLVHSIEYENPMKHVSNWMGSLVRSNHQQGHVKASEVMPDIIGIIRSAIGFHGWDSDVQPVMLPPMNAQENWAPFRRMGHNPSDELPMLMVFRVQLLNKSMHGNQYGYSAFSCCTGCELYPIAASEYDHISMQIQDGLRRLRHAVSGQTECVDAAGACHSLMNKGIMQANAVISQSRGQHSGYGGGGVGMGGGGGFGGGSEYITIPQQSYGGGQMGGGQLPGGRQMGSGQLPGMGNSNGYGGGGIGSPGYGGGGSGYGGGGGPGYGGRGHGGGGY